MAIYRQRGLRGLGDAGEFGEMTPGNTSGWTTDAWGDVVPATILPSASGGGVADTGVLGSGITLNQAIDAIKSLITTGQQADAQRQIIALNTQRVQQGQAPLPASYFQPTAASAAAAANSQSFLKWGAIGLIGLGIFHALSH